MIPDRWITKLFKVRVQLARRAGDTHGLNLQEKRLSGERPSITKNDKHLIWKLSHDNVTVLPFDFYCKVSSEMLLAVSVFLFVLH